MNKKIILSISISLLAAILIALPVPVDAIGFANTARAVDRATVMNNQQTAQLATLQNRANTLIATRLASLQRLTTRIQNDTRLSDADKATFLGNITTTSSNLSALKTKIDADTDLTTARTDAKSIITNYKIYVIFEPQVRLTVIVDNLQTTMASVSALIPRVQTLLTTLQGQGRNMTPAQTALTDVTSQLTTINTMLTSDKTLVANVTTGTSDPESIFTQVRKDLATIRTDIEKIQADFAIIRSSIRTTAATPITKNPTN